MINCDEVRCYPCADCGVLRSKAEGGTIFTVCDACWDRAYLVKLRERLSILARNLRDAAFGCVAFSRGASFGYWEGACRVSSDDPEEINPSWRPGCGKAWEGR